jgi:hypothetical protein
MDLAVQRETGLTKDVMTLHGTNILVRKSEKHKSIHKTNLACGKNFMGVSFLHLKTNFIV